jgi:hypothetical protein
LDAGERLDLEGIVVTEVGRNGHKVAWLQKPFGPGQLEELIQVALELLGMRARRDCRPTVAI